MSSQEIVFRCFQNELFDIFNKNELLKKLFEFNLGEKIPGRAKDRAFYNAAEKHERAYLPKRKTVRKYKK